MPGQKCLVDVAGRPFLYWKLEQLVANGATELHLLCSYRYLDVMDAVDAWDHDTLVIYHLDDGIGQWAAHDKAVDEGLPFVHWLTYGDSLLDVPLAHSKLPYVYVNDEHPRDAGVIYTWGKAKKFIPKYTTERAHHLNTPADLEETRAHIRGYCLAR